MLVIVGVVTVKLLSSLLFFYVTLKNIDQNCQLGRTVCMTTDAETCALCFIKCVVVLQCGKLCYVSQW